MLRIAFLILLTSISFSAMAEQSVWLGADRKAWPDTEYRKSKDSFGAYLLVTSNLNWQEKWETPPSTIPYFDEVDSVKIGDRLVILTFFVNPKTNPDNHALVLCGIKVTRPDGSQSANHNGIKCLEGELQGNPDAIRLSPAAINFVGEANDPLGKWIVEVQVHDVFRETVLNLKKSFFLEPDNG